MNVHENFGECRRNDIDSDEITAAGLRAVSKNASAIAVGVGLSSSAALCAAANGIFQFTVDSSGCSQEGGVWAAMLVTSLANFDIPDQRFTAELLRSSLLSVNGMRDCMTLSGDIVYITRTSGREQAFSRLCSRIFQFMPEFEFRSLFRESVREIRALRLSITAMTGSGEFAGSYGEPEFYYGMLSRLLTSITVNAGNEDILAVSGSYASSGVRAGIYGVRKALPYGGAPSEESRRLRLDRAYTSQRISEAFSYAALHAIKHGKKRICCVSPSRVLLKHAQSVYSASAAADIPVQFMTNYDMLGILYGGGRERLSEMLTLCDAVIISDELMTMKKSLISLFNLGVNFITEYCRSEVIFSSSILPPANITDACRMLPAEYCYPLAYAAMETDKLISCSVTDRTGVKIGEQELFAEASRVPEGTSSAYICFDDAPTGDIDLRCCEKRAVRLTPESLLYEERRFERVFTPLLPLTDLMRAALICRRELIIFAAADCGDYISSGGIHIPEAEYNAETETARELISAGAPCSKALERYYSRMIPSLNGALIRRMPQPNSDVTLADVLSVNTPGTKALRGKGYNPRVLFFRQAFGSAGQIIETDIENGESV
ncbi:MAG: hypothetical protein WCQ72_04070 [Eubacteriales bacterium]